MKRTLAILAFTLLFALPHLAQGGNAKKAPAISLKDLSGKTVKIGDFKGKIVLLNFWAVWCVPCAAEVPNLVKWQVEYKDKLQIVGITYPPTNIGKIRSFVRKNGINYPVLLGSKSTKKLFESTENLPITVILNKQGNIADRIDGVVFDDEFDNKIKPLLK
jgi:thiol-disulfide isomerase/thioredoxin